MNTIQILLRIVNDIVSLADDINDLLCDIQTSAKTIYQSAHTSLVLC